jgi:hypothetical protein
MNEEKMGLSLQQTEDGHLGPKHYVTVTVHVAQSFFF